MENKFDWNKNKDISLSFSAIPDGNQHHRNGYASVVRYNSRLCLKAPLVQIYHLEKPIPQISEINSKKRAISSISLFESLVTKTTPSPFFNGSKIVDNIVS